jgi:Fe-S-cluster-containing hydrogenase component 2
MDPQNLRAGDSEPALVSPGGVGSLISALKGRGYEVIGPTARNGAIVHDAIESLADLPAGLGDEQRAAHYRLRPRGDGALFGFSLAAQSWKRLLHPPEQRLLRITRADGSLRFEPDRAPPPRLAFLGVRACDLQAIRVLDRVLSEDRYPDGAYQGRRGKVFIVAVHCVEPAATCFCSSMGSGPRALEGFDLALTEILEGEHRFLVETASAAGREVLAEIGPRPAAEEDLQAAGRLHARALAGLERSLDTHGIKELLYQRTEHPRWKEVAARCLACANCTMVCPTCFCTTVDETCDLDLQTADRWKRWDSCFTLGFSYIHGGCVRASPAARYRQWLTHKLAFWQDQFGMLGCVGCGRCIAWCPVGIDITEETRALRTVPRREAAP